MKYFSTIIKLYHTLKPLKFDQFWYRLIRKVFPLRQLHLSHSAEKVRQFDWVAPEFMLPKILAGNKVSFLNKTAELDVSFDWNNPSYEKLWLYNLHYFDDLNALDGITRKDQQYLLIKRWIAENPPLLGNGWEPYTLSLRLVNWIKWYQRFNIQDDTILVSISEQAEALFRQLEYHIFGNHLFANAKALVFVGCFIQSEQSQKYLDLGLKILEKEVSEQFLADGGHFELSPMYHNILLWDLLDLINLGKVTHGLIPQPIVKFWQDTSKRALEWLDVMSHTDGEVSFFNDSAIGIAAPPEVINNYAFQLGITKSKPSNKIVTTLESTGYSRITRPNYSIIFDHASIGPDYLPAHGHADTLSFECSIHSERLIVNSGTSIYGVSPERLRQRQTPAHSTVVIDNSDSSEVWSGFRVARRANGVLENVNVDNGTITLTASHDGYLRLKGKVVHKRSITSCLNSFDVDDLLTGTTRNAYAIYHLHPKVEVKEISRDQVELKLPSGKRVNVTASFPIEVKPSSWHPEFGISISSVCLKIELKSASLKTTFSILQD